MTGVGIQIVNLERATARRAIMAGLCAERGLTVRFFPAVDAAAPDQAARLAALPDEGELGAFMPHDKACTLSHLDILRDFVASGDSHLLVLEDDVFIAADMAGWLADMGWWPQGADLVKVERWRDDRLVVALERRGTRHMGRAINRLLSRHTGTGGYLIARSGAIKVLDGVAQVGGRVSMPIDHLLFNPQASAICRSLVIHQVEPALVMQGNDPPGYTPGAPRKPQGDILKRQRRKRLSLELRSVRDSILMWIAGRARPAHITFADRIQPSGS